MDDQYGWMVIRQAFGGEYWEKTSFGPMSEKQADEMLCNSKYDGFKCRVEDFQKEYYG